MVIVFSKFASILPKRVDEINQGDTVQIHKVSGKGIGPLTFSWSPNFNISDTTASDPFVWPDTTTIYDCIVTDSVGCISSYPDNWTVIVKPVSVQELKSSNVQILVHPNPITQNSVAQIEKLSDFEGYKFVINNIKGESIKYGQLSSKIPIGNYISQSGVYFLNIYHHNRLISVKKLIRL